MTANPIVSGITPTTGEIAGQPIVLHYGDIAHEYGALREGAMLVDRSSRGRMRVDGARAGELITGMVTNDVLSLRSGMGQYAAALNPKGKIVADLRIFAHRDHLLIDIPVRAREGWQAMVRKYVNPRLAPYSDESAEIRDIGIFGMFGGPIGATDGRYTYYLYPEDLYAPGLHEYTLMPMHLHSMFSAAEMRTSKLVGPFDFTKGMQVLRIDALKDARRIPIHDNKKFDPGVGTTLYDLATDPKQIRPFRDAVLERRFHAGIDEQLRAPSERRIVVVGAEELA